MTDQKSRIGHVIADTYRIVQEIGAAVPIGAQVLLDGVVVPAIAVMAEKTERCRLLRIFHPSYEPWECELPFEADRRVTVSLTRQGA